MADALWSCAEMQVVIENRGAFKCPLRRAFVAPILGDATRFLSGYRLQPGIVGFEDDSTWGRPGGVRYPITRGNLLVPSGRLLTDRILDRQEDLLWRWEISEFCGAMGVLIERATGSWEVRLNDFGLVDVVYRYCYFVRYRILFPALWFLARLHLKGMHQKAFWEIKKFAESNSALSYEEQVAAEPPHTT